MDDMKKELTSFVYTFEEMIKGNFLYVDKTEFTGISSVLARQDIS
jgi:hypothetical protein